LQPIYPIGVGYCLLFALGSREPHGSNSSSSHASFYYCFPLGTGWHKRYVMKKIALYLFLLIILLIVYLQDFSIIDYDVEHVPFNIFHITPSKLLFGR
jgi:hypothetical protein